MFIDIMTCSSAHQVVSTTKRALEASMNTSSSNQDEILHMINSLNTVITDIACSSAPQVSKH